MILVTLLWIYCSLSSPFLNKENWSCTWYSDTALSCLVRHKYFLLSTGKTWSISNSICPFVPGTYCGLLAVLWSPNILRSVPSSIISKQQASSLYQKLSVIPKSLTLHFIPLTFSLFLLLHTWRSSISSFKIFLPFLH